MMYLATKVKPKRRLVKDEIAANPMYAVSLRVDANIRALAQLGYLYQCLPGDAVTKLQVLKKPKL